MKTILTAAAAAALIAVPALAQTPSAQTAYEQQLRAIYAQMEYVQNGQKEASELQQQAMILKAEAYRHGVILQVPPQPEATASVK